VAHVASRPGPQDIAALNEPQKDKRMNRTATRLLENVEFVAELKAKYEMTLRNLDSD